MVLKFPISPLGGKIACVNTREDVYIGISLRITLMPVRTIGKPMALWTNMFLVEYLLAP